MKLRRILTTGATALLCGALAACTAPPAAAPAPAGTAAASVSATTSPSASPSAAASNASPAVAANADALEYWSPGHQAQEVPTSSALGVDSVYLNLTATFFDYTYVATYKSDCLVLIRPDTDHPGTALGAMPAIRTVVFNRFGATAMRDVHAIDGTASQIKSRLGALSTCS